MNPPNYLLYIPPPQNEEEKAPLIQEPTNQSDGVLLTPYDLYSNEVPKVTSILQNEPFMKITVKKILQLIS